MLGVAAFVVCLIWFGIDVVLAGCVVGLVWFNWLHYAVFWFMVVALRVGLWFDDVLAVLSC